MFGGDRRVFGSGVGDRRARGEGFVVERAAGVEEAGGLRGPGGALLGCLVVLTTSQQPCPYVLAAPRSVWPVWMVRGWGEVGRRLWSSEPLRLVVGPLGTIGKTTIGQWGPSGRRKSGFNFEGTTLCMWTPALAYICMGKSSAGVHIIKVVPPYSCMQKGPH